MESILKIEHLNKIYKIYNSNKERIKEAFSFKNNKKYGRDFYALEDITFDVCKGETVGIIGSNGAGKSTLLKIITGVLQKTDGVLEIKGKVSALLELGAGFNPELTGIENIYLNGTMLGYSKFDMDVKINGIVDFADIGDFINQPVKMYSSGMFARLAFAVAINVEPDILIVDEALSVGDIFFQNKCFKKFEELREKGVTILFVSHDITTVRQLCSRVMWIENGKEKIFSDSETVCDMYMDEKRKKMNEVVDKQNFEGNHFSNMLNSDQNVYPSIKNKNDRFKCTTLEVASAFVMEQGKEAILTTIEVDKNYEMHVLLNMKKDMTDLIVGFVFENNKGLPIFDINNYINNKTLIEGKNGSIIEVVYKFKLPRLLKGIYLLSVAVAQGTQENHEILTWLHGVSEIEIVNNGYNSSYIEIEGEISLYERECNKIKFY